MNGTVERHLSGGRVKWVVSVLSTKSDGGEKDSYELEFKIINQVVLYVF